MNGELSFDVAVVGGGVAGVAAACAAADRGARAVVLERYGVLGGVATVSGVGTLCGLFLRGEGEPRWGACRFAREFALAHILRDESRILVARDGVRFVPYSVPLFHGMLAKDLATRGVEVRVHVTVASASAEGAMTLGGIEWGVPFRLSARTVVDATGEALVSTLLGLETEDSGPRQAPALSLAVRGLDPAADERTLNVMLAKLFADETRARLGKLSVLPGSKRNECASLKFAAPRCVRLERSEVHGEIELETRRALESALESARRELPACRAVEVIAISPQVGFRTGRRPVGRSALTEESVRGCAKPSDGVAPGAWPIELWGEAARAEFECFAAHDHYLVPAGALESRDVRTLFFCGRGISGDERALASARVIGTAIGTGYAAGALAADAALGRERDETIEWLRTTQCSGLGEPYVPRSPAPGVV